jgi:tRNA (cmo5U34)-methyltransferase
VTVGALFGQAAWDYDRARRQLVPDFDRFYGAVLESIPFRGEQEILVLDLGAGTGLLSAVVAVEVSAGAGDAR